MISSEIVINCYKNIIVKYRMLRWLKNKFFIIIDKINNS